MKKIEFNTIAKEEKVAYFIGTEVYRMRFVQARSLTKTGAI